MLRASSPASNGECLLDLVFGDVMPDRQEGALPGLHLFAEQRIELSLRRLPDEEARGDNDDAKPAAGDALLDLLPVLWPAVNASVSAPSALPPGDLSGPVTLGDRRGPSGYPGALTR